MNGRGINHDAAGKASARRGTLYLFPGQGSQKVGIGRRAVGESRLAAKFWDEAGALLGRDIRDLCWNSKLSYLTRTENAQVALTAASIADWLAASEKGSLSERDENDACAGHSVGALASAVVAGYLSPIEGTRLAAIRGKLMASAPEGGTMLAVTSHAVLSEAELAKKAAEFADRFEVEVAALNTLKQFVLAGETNRIQKAAIRIGAGAKVLNVSNAFHSRFMDPIEEEWHKALDLAEFVQGDGWYVGCTTAHPTKNIEEVRRDLGRGLKHTVRWLGVMEKTLDRARIRVFGPGAVISRLARPYIQGRPVRCTGDGR